ECPNCIEQVAVDAKFAGKQAPCPNCRRVVRVPQLADPRARDWRAADARPTLAKRDTDAAVEGAWGSTTTTSVVSRDALAEADAHLRKARDQFAAAEAGGADKAIERVLLLTEIALTQARLGGDKAAADAGARVEWAKLQPELRRTMQALGRDGLVTHEGVML